MSGKARAYEADRLWQYIDGDADRYIAAGVDFTFAADYRYQDKFDAVVDIHMMKTPAGARKVLESESPVGSQPIQIGDSGRESKGSVTFIQGRYFVRIVAYQESPEIGDALVALAKAVSTRLGRSGM